jgi:hypothetical protein
MPISGLVVALVDDLETRRTALAMLAQHPAIDVGEPAGGRVPIVVETLDENDDRLVWEWIHTVPGVTFVVVAYIHFDEDPSDVELPASFQASQPLPLPTGHEL